MKVSIVTAKYESTEYTNGEFIELALLQAENLVCSTSKVTILQKKLRVFSTLKRHSRSKSPADYLFLTHGMIRGREGAWLAPEHVDNDQIHALGALPVFLELVPGLPASHEGEVPCGLAMLNTTLVSPHSGLIVAPVVSVIVSITRDVHAICPSC